MLWIYITISAYLLFSLANIGDKLVVSQYKTEPIVYAFYVGFLGIGTLIFIPFGVIIPEAIQFFWSFLGGIFFVLALFSMYKAIEAGETTKAITLLGGSSPIFTFLLSYLFLGERLAASQLLAFIALVLAIIIISWPLELGAKKQLNKKLIFWGICAGFVFAGSFVLAKYIYLQQPFISGFFWIRMGGFLTALIIFLVPKHRKLIKIDWQRPKKQKSSLILAIQAFGGLGVLGQNYAFSLASATLVNALQAIQYAFVFVLASLLGFKIPALKEQLNWRQILQKILAIILIAVGLYFIIL